MDIKMKKREPEPPDMGYPKWKLSSSYTSENQIFSFIKSRHFVKKQRSRKITDSLLARVLWQVRPTPNSTTLIVRNSEIRKLIKAGMIEDTLKGQKKDLVVVLDGRVLITCFLTDARAYCTSSSIVYLHYLYINL